MRFEFSLSKQPCHPERSEERKRCGLSFLSPNNLVIPSAARDLHFPTASQPAKILRSSA
jgi:hypothetical protein